MFVEKFKCKALESLIVFDKMLGSNMKKEFIVVTQDPRDGSDAAFYQKV